MSTVSSCERRSFRIVRVSWLYSELYDAFNTISSGSFPSLRIMTRGSWYLSASIPASRNPRASIPAMAVIFLSCIYSQKTSTILHRASTSKSNGDISRNKTPGFGKSGWFEMRALRSESIEGVYSIPPDCKSLYCPR